MFDLSDAVIIIPVRIDQPQRLVNLERTVSFLKAHLTAAIHVIEQDSVSRVPDSLRSEFIRDGDTFYKTRLFNYAANTTSKSVLFFLDVDVLVDPEAYRLAYTKLRDNASDVCLLYTRDNKRYQYVNVDPAVLADIPPAEWMAKLATLEGETAKCEGGIVAMRRDAFQSMGGFNERFIGYGQEDCELLYRAKRHGLRYTELPFSIYHQSHNNIYMWNAIKRDHISHHTLNFTISQPLDVVQRELRAGQTRYVTMKPSGGRLGNLLFELAGLFQYAKMTGRRPYMPIPSQYQSFLQPLSDRMVMPPSSPAPKRVESFDGQSAVFYTEFPLLYEQTPVLELAGGYLQSPEMFRDVRWMLQDLLGSKDESYPETRVLLHVRRGDYAKHSFTYEQLGPLYYTRAMKYVKAKHPTCKFVVFSDDLPAVRTESYLHRDDVEFFDDTGMSATAVLQEMTRYKSFILANSTFGLWGAFLSSSADTVVAPFHWSRADTSACLGLWTTLYEPTWVRISNRPLVIRTDNPQFDLFAPASETERADVAFYIAEVPTERPNATVVALLTNHPHTYASKPRPSHIDCMFSTEFDHINPPHSSWAEHPFVYVGPPGTLQHFHFVQAVAETLVNRPKVSVLVLGGGDTRPGMILQSLNSVYQQTERSWEILFPSPHGPTCPIGHYLFEYLALPKLLVVLPGSPTVFHVATQARSGILAYVSAKSLSAKTRLESELDLYSPKLIVATHYADEYNQVSLVPASVGARIASIPDLHRFRTTFLAHRGLLNGSCWFDGDTLIRFVPSPKVRFMAELYQWKPKPRDHPEHEPPSLPNPTSEPLARTQSILVAGYNRGDSSVTRSQRFVRAEWIGEIEMQKKKFGLNYLI